MAVAVSYPVIVRVPFRRSASGAPPDDADAADVRRAAEGDEAAFEVLVLRHQRPVYNLAWRLLGDRDDAEDAVQEAFLRAWRALPRFRGDASFRTWLTGIAINVCRNRLAGAAARRRRATVSLVRRDAASGEEGIVEPVDPAPGPEAVTGARESRAALERALAELSPEHREIILLREMSGLEYEELASVLGCALGTVKSRIARARGALRRALEGVWP
jgi:RNA polymerase sigma factor (sigma-70 family)